MALNSGDEGSGCGGESRSCGKCFHRGISLCGGGGGCGEETLVVGVVVAVEIALWMQ